MKRMHVLMAVGMFVLGVVAGVAGSSGSKVDKVMYAGQSPKDAALGLLTAALKQAGSGSWENIAVGRVYYLTGDKTQGQAIFDRVIAKKVKKDDWIRMGRVYLEAKEWDKAKDAFDKALALDPKDEGNLTEIGAWYNLHGDRAKAEEYFDRAFASKPDEIWYTVNAAGSYVGVKPQ
ncbi:MAG TPA: tetratricopeptide repeat protein [Thermoanaerobaculaceae bacterium]|nr:tetratricopeptide repeat protein [Thermoanaerobaculaceae bacterium]